MLVVPATLLIGILHHVGSFLAFLPFDEGQFDAHLPCLATNFLLLRSPPKYSATVLYSHSLSLIE
jgi:hypothetical protein